MQWLMDQRENECPACRSVFIEDDNIIDDNSTDILGSSSSDNGLNDSIEVDLEKGILRDTTAPQDDRDDDIIGNSTSTVTLLPPTFYIAKGRIIVVDNDNNNDSSSVSPSLPALSSSSPSASISESAA